MTKKKAIEIIKNINQTVKKMGKSSTIHSDNPMFKHPRAKSSDLIKKRNILKKKYDL